MKASRAYWAAAVLCGIGLGAGCKKAEEKPKPGGEPEPAATQASGEQTLCPVSGHAIDADVSVMHEGKKVAFCCDDCIKKFQDNPAKYTAKLPQFGGTEDGEYEGM